MRRLLLAAALAGGLTSPSLAYFQDGNEILSLCTSQEVSDRRACLFYIEGAKDAWETLQFWYPAIPRCMLAPGVTAGQVRDVVVQYLQQHPEERHRPASSLVIPALRQAFCP